MALHLQQNVGSRRARCLRGPQVMWSPGYVVWELLSGQGSLKICGEVLSATRWKGSAGTCCTLIATGKSTESFDASSTLEEEGMWFLEGVLSDCCDL